MRSSSCNGRLEPVGRSERLVEVLVENGRTVPLEQTIDQRRHESRRQGQWPISARLFLSFSTKTMRLSRSRCGKREPRVLDDVIALGGEADRVERERLSSGQETIASHRPMP